jgi:putative DNA primase/helicase
MREPEMQYRNLREAIISANLQTGATLRNQWVYEDESNLEALRILDYESEDDGRRQIRAVFPVSPGEEGRCMGEPPGRWPLYRLPELEPFQRVYLCQDERSAEAARSMGLVATTAALGCYKLHKTDFSPLAGRDVVVLPNIDQEGRVFVNRATSILARQLPPAEVRVMKLPGVGLHGGLCEFMLMRHPKEPAEIGADIDEMVDELPEYCTLHLPAPTMNRMLDVRPAPVQWLWPERIVMGKLNLLYGSSGTSAQECWKSLLGIELAARVSRGMPWPDGSGAAPLGSVVMLVYEDGLADTIRPMLEQAGADLSRIFALGPARRKPGGRPELTSVDGMHRAIDEAVLRSPGGKGEVKLVLIDPMTWYLSGNANATLRALATLAHERNVAVVMVMPFDSQAGGLARLRAMSGPVLTAARLAWLAVADAGDGERRLLLPVKSSLLGREPAGLAFRIVDGRVQWEKGAVHLRPQDVLLARRGQKKPGPPPAKRIAAADWLRQRLAAGPVYVGNHGWPEAGSLRLQAKDAGLAWGTVLRAFRSIKAASERCEATGRYRWRLV